MRQLKLFCLLFLVEIVRSFAYNSHQAWAVVPRATGAAAGFSTLKVPNCNSIGQLRVSDAIAGGIWIVVKVRAVCIIYVRRGIIGISTGIRSIDATCCVNDGIRLIL